MAIAMTGLTWGGWYAARAAPHAIGDCLPVAGMFALNGKVRPRTHPHGREVWTGPVFAAILFIVGKSVVDLHISASA